MKFLVRGPVDARSGYGNDVVGLLVALQEAGQEVTVWPTSVYPPLPMSVAQLLTHAIKPPYDVVLWYGPPDLVNPRELPGWGRVHLGWTMWERTPFTVKHLPWHDPEGWSGARGHVWSEPPRRSWMIGEHVRRKDWLDALIVTAGSNVDAFRAVDETLRIEVLAPGLDCRQWPARKEYSAKAPITVAAHGVMAGRKDPRALIEAWRLHLAQRTIPTELVIKTSGSRWPATGFAMEADDVEVLAGMWSQQQMLDWYHQVDVLVSASRGEGMNKPAVEAMATGIPVVATAAAGHANWQSEQWGYPVRHLEAPSPFEDGTTDWPPDVEHLAARITEATHQHEDRLLRGQRAAGVVRANLDWNKVLPKFLRLTAQLMR